MLSQLKNKKRTANTLIRRRNVVKKQRPTANEYNNISNNKLIPKYVTSPACKCLSKYFTYITEEKSILFLNILI